MQEALKADTGSDLKLQFALQRRSLAFDQARLCDYDKFEKWTTILMQAFTATPPENYHKISIEQIQRADLELFKFMMKETRGGIRPVSGKAPLEAALDKALMAPEVRLNLQPLQATMSVKRKGEHADDFSEQKRTKDDSMVEKLKKTVDNLQGQLKNLRVQQHSSSSGQPKGKGKKGSNKGKFIRMPPGLLGLSPVVANGEPACFDFNLGGCTRAKPGEKCSKGWHSCMHHGCFGPHSQKEHK